MDTYTPVHKLEGSNALASTSAVFLVSDSPGYPELDNVTARDSVLKNPDLMAKTFSHLKAMDLDYGSHDLFNAPLTCKDFLDVELDALWEKLDSLVPLLKLLPTLQVVDEAYVCANVHIFLYDLILSLGP